MIKKYSDYIRYPIKMNVETQKMKEGTEESEKPEYETVVEDQTFKLNGSFMETSKIEDYR